MGHLDDSPHNHSPHDDSPSDSVAERSANQIFFWTIVVEGGLVLLALFLGYLGVRDSRVPLVPQLSIIEWRWLSVWGAAATIPLMVMLLVVDRAPGKWLEKFRRTHKPALRELFESVSVMGLLFISVMAGLGEELLFRWSLQGGLTVWIGGGLGAAVAIAITSILFGLAHFLSWTYAVWAFAVSIYFGVLMWLTGHWVVPALAHAAYDFFALIYLTRIGVDRIEIADAKL